MLIQTNCFSRAETQVGKQQLCALTEKAIITIYCLAQGAINGISVDRRGVGIRVISSNVLGMIIMKAVLYMKIVNQATFVIQ
jgi:hypothetical protein